MTKLIGLSPRLLTIDTVEKQFVNTRYLIPLNKRGLNTLMISLDNPNLEAILRLCDGFLITGGADLEPTFYNEVNNGLSKGIDLRLDNLDKRMIEHAVKHKKPLLGICRGHQSLNVFLGGTLYQDLGDLNNDHNKIKENHFINIDKNDFINIEGLINVNSYHHQAIKELAKDLQVIGRHPDQTIEMVVHKTLPIFAVQWHPEINSDSKISQIIFDKFSTLINHP